MMDRARLQELRASAEAYLATNTPPDPVTGRGIIGSPAPVVGVGELVALAALGLRKMDVEAAFSDLLTAADNRHQDPKGFAEAIERAKAFARNY